VRRRHDFWDVMRWMIGILMDTDLDFCPFDYAPEIIEDADVWYGSRVKTGEALA
jgi:hypothetical protein